MKRRTYLGNILVVTAVVLLGALGAVFCGQGDTEALNFTSTEEMQFTFNPTVSISLSGDLEIDSLSPGGYADSDNITVTATTNDLSGYTLYATVGSSSYAYTDLRISSSDTTNVFSNLTSTASSLSDFGDSEWGYAYSTNSGSTWISGDCDDYDSGYNGLPYYTSTGVMLADVSSSSSLVTTSLLFKIGARASYTQAAGEYTNVVNFYAVTKATTTTYNLTYTDNSGEASGMPSNVISGTTTNAIVTLSSTTPTRSGYVFEGWCDTDNSSDVTACSGTTYMPGASYVIADPSQTATINMYAIWASE